jgi:chromosome segregation ATPase
MANVTYQARGRVTSVDASLAAGGVRYRANVALDAEISAFAAQHGPESAIEHQNVPAAAPSGLTEGVLEQTVKELETRASAAEARTEQAEARLKEVEALQANAAAAMKQAGTRIKQLEQMVETAQQREGALTTHLTDAEAAWEAERNKLQADVADAVERAAELEAAHEKDRRDWTAQKSRLTARLEATERWCADQQDVLYEIQGPVTKLSALLAGWKPDQASDSTEEATIVAEQKATA